MRRCCAPLRQRQDTGFGERCGTPLAPHRNGELSPQRLRGSPPRRAGRGVWKRTTLLPREARYSFIVLRSAFCISHGVTSSGAAAQPSPKGEDRVLGGLLPKFLPLQGMGDRPPCGWWMRSAKYSFIVLRSSFLIAPVVTSSSAAAPPSPKGEGRVLGGLLPKCLPPSGGRGTARLAGGG